MSQELADTTDQVAVCFLAGLLLNFYHHNTRLRALCVNKPGVTDAHSRVRPTYGVSSEASY